MQKLIGVVLMGVGAVLTFASGDDKKAENSDSKAKGVPNNENLDNDSSKHTPGGHPDGVSGGAVEKTGLSELDANPPKPDEEKTDVSENAD